jgi:hypothetical protein
MSEVFCERRCAVACVRCTRLVGPTTLPDQLFFGTI